MGQIKQVCGQIQPAGCQFEISGKLWRRKEVKYFLDSPSANLVRHSLGDHCGSLVKGRLKMFWRLQLDPKEDTTFLPYIFPTNFSHTQTCKFSFHRSRITNHFWSASVTELKDIMLACTQENGNPLKHIDIPKDRLTLITVVFAFNKKQNVLNSRKLFSEVWSNPFKI